MLSGETPAVGGGESDDSDYDEDEENEKILDSPDAALWTGQMPKDVKVLRLASSILSFLLWADQ